VKNAATQQNFDVFTMFGSSTSSCDKHLLCERWASAMGVQRRRDAGRAMRRYRDSILSKQVLRWYRAKFAYFDQIAEMDIKSLAAALTMSET